MADQRQPFRFRLPWLPPTATPAAPPPRPRQPAAAPPRPAFRPPGVGPAQPPPRVDPPPPKTTEQGSASKTTSTPKTEPPSKPIAPTGPQTAPQQPTPPKTEPPLKPTSPPKAEPSSKPITSTGPQTTALQPAPPKTEPPSKATAPPKTEPPSEPTSPPKTEPPSKPIAQTGPQTRTLQPAPATEPPSTKPIASTRPQTTPPKTEPPSKLIGSTETQTRPPRTEPPPSSSVSTLTNAKTTTSPPKPPSPSRSPARLKLTSPSSSSPPSPRDKTPPKRKSPSATPKYPSSPTLSNQSSPFKNASTPDEVVVPKPSTNPIQTSSVHQNGEPVNKGVIEVPESETVLEPVAVHRKEMITTSGVGKRAAQTSSSTPNSYPKQGKPIHNHKPAPLQKEIKEDISRFVNKLGAGNGKQTLDGEKQMTVITLAGENRGAAMTLSNESSKKESPIHIHRGYRLNPDENIENSTDGKEGSKTDEETATKACINSNVQGINNSLLFNGSVSTMNPGVRYIRGQDMAESSNRRRFDEEGSYETRKAEVSRIQSDMLAYAPTVRRRCLRGLLMESSDSDTEKPRRHGCYYDRKDKKKGKDGNVDSL